jgi:hypothetical protein
MKNVEDEDIDEGMLVNESPDAEVEELQD